MHRSTLLLLLVLTQAHTAIQVFFGSGCFWERQYAYAWDMELNGTLAGNSRLFGRNMDTVTAVAGYAGSKRTGIGGLVCYHGAADDNDYGLLGMAEAVQVELSEGQEVAQYTALVENFFQAYTQGGRPDPGDQGSEYRSMVGLPGGVNGTLFHIVVNANKRLAVPDQLLLKEGAGEEQDAVGVAWVYDSNLFPFHRAEQYHQFHSNFAPPDYGPDYLDTLWKRQIALGRINSTGCPEGQHW